MRTVTRKKLYWGKSWDHCKLCSRQRPRCRSSSTNPGAGFTTFYSAPKVSYHRGQTRAVWVDQRLGYSPPCFNVDYKVFAAYKFCWVENHIIVRDKVLNQTNVTTEVQPNPCRVSKNWRNWHSNLLCRGLGWSWVYFFDGANTFIVCFPSQPNLISANTLSCQSWYHDINSSGFSTFDTFSRDACQAGISWLGNGAFSAHYMHCRYLHVDNRKITFSAFLVSLLIST